MAIIMSQYKGCKTPQGCGGDGQQLSLAVGGDDTEELPEVVPEELTSEEEKELEPNA